uniref:C2H2-type domain-containing protein n=1 Tax=Stomoxys calcitrans TaxID=35570 RepID=A0A1I8P6G8_STOCA
MRILRSQYLQLQKNANNTTKTTSYHQTQITSRPVPCTRSQKIYDLRSRDHGGKILSRLNNDKINKNSTASARGSLRQALVRTESVRNVTYRHYSSDSESSSSSSTTDSSKTSSSSTSESSSTNSTSTSKTVISKTNSSGYETLNHSRQHDINRRQNQVSLVGNAKANGMQPTYVKSMVEQYNHMRIRFLNVPRKVGKINVTVEFKDMGPKWLSALYHQYENDLWAKEPREKSRTGKNRWYFTCKLCQRSLCSFPSLKSHINSHLELYPYVCKFCAKSYTNRSSIVTHLKSKHEIYANFQLFLGQ